MNDITVGDIATTLGIIAGIITSLGIICGVVYKFVKSFTSKRENILLDEVQKMKQDLLVQIESTDKILADGMQAIKEDINDVKIGICKDYLVTFMSSVEAGIAKDSSEIERAYEAMEKYTNELHQNSYIHKRWEEIEPKIIKK